MALTPRNTLLAVHCREEEVSLLKESLMQSHLIDWQGRLCVFHVPEYLVDTVKDVVKDKGGQELTINKCYTYTGDGIGDPHAYLAENPIRCPAGIRVARLGRAGVSIMRNTAEYDICRTLDDMVYITKHAPSVGLYEDPSVEKETTVDIENLPFARDEEVPVAWITTSFYGAMGTMMALEGYRSRGYGELVTRILTLMEAAESYVPVGHLDIDNFPSVNSLNRITKKKMQVVNIKWLHQLLTARPAIGLCTRRDRRRLHWGQKEDPFTLVTEGMVDLAHRIKGNSPFSDSIYNGLLLHGRGHARECSFYTLRGRPDSNVVMWRYLQPRNTLLAVHCREEEVSLLKESLMQSHLIDWQGRLCVFHVPEYLVDTVKDVVKDKGGQELTINKCYTYIGDTYLAENPIQCPAGLRVARLGRAGVSIMRNTAEYDICRTLDDMVYITKHAPSVGLYEDPSVEKETTVDIENLPFARDEEVPVAWITTSFYGALGTWMARKRYRNHRHGQLVVRVAVLMQAAQGYIPHGHVDIDNDLSKNSLDKISDLSLSSSVYFMFRK